MNIEHMYMVIRLAEFGNFSMAADACFVSQSSFSRNIQNIEKDLGAQLFIRKKNGVLLTPEGKTFVKHAKDLLKHYEEMRSKLNNQLKHDKEYTIGLLNVSNIHTILPLITGFIEQNPGSKISLHELDWKPLQAQMQEGYFDAVISWRETLPENMEKYPLAKDFVVLIVAKNHPLAVYHEQQLDSIAVVCDETFVFSTPSPPTKVIDRLFNAEGFKPKFFHSVSHPCSMMHLVEKGMGVGIIANSTYEVLKNKNVSRIFLKTSYDFEYAACFFDNENRLSKSMIEFFNRVK